MAETALTIKQEELVPLLAQNKLGDILKPLIREIELFETYIAGTAYLKDPTVLDALEPGQQLTLQREDNRFDDNAILLLNAEGIKLGYVPERDNAVFARLMDAGKMLSARVKSSTIHGTVHRIRVCIYLIDV